MPGVEAGKWLCLVTLLAATHSTEPAYSVHEPEPGLVHIEALHDEIPTLSVDKQDLSVRAAASHMEVRFSPNPDLPEALHAWSANI